MDVNAYAQLIGVDVLGYDLSTGIDWPFYVQNAFDAVDERDNALSGAWTKLLNFLFPIDSDFVVVPWGPLDGRRTIDSSFSFGVQFGIANRGIIPVLAVDLKPEWQIRDNDALRNADTQIRDRLIDLRTKSPLRTLYGLSVVGNYFCIYEMTELEITPAVISSNTKLDPEQWRTSSTDLNTSIGRHNLFSLIRDLGPLAREAFLNLAPVEPFSEPSVTGKEEADNVKKDPTFHPGNGI
ncbi:hypothetical protein B0H11DRAFT_2214646 [Mycena galericulata]|nr:hypothetical protein B0H11DRAFT_2214646 [Mycena galericulata]